MQPSSTFVERQARFVERLKERGLAGLDDGTIVIIQSLSFPESECRKIVGIERYEERLLCALLLLRNPATSIVYVTSMAVDSEVIDYYLGFVDAPDARDRLTVVEVNTPGPRPLAEKLLEAPDRIDAVRSAVGDSHAYLLPFNVTILEEALSDELDLPLFGPAPDQAELGSKTGSKRVARAAGVSTLEGVEDLWSESDVTDALAALRALRSDARSAVIKLNNGFSGQGNAIIDLSDLRTPLHHSPTVFCAEEESWTTYQAKIEAEGAVVEELVRGIGIVSPSVQMRIAPGGEFEILSTHDQILGGPDDQVYLGCKFPADPAYRRDIQERAKSVASVLAQHGVIGSFGIDFIVVSRGKQRGIYLSEINLRLGGTTHPFLMGRLVTGGTYDPDSGELLVDGEPRCYISSDNLKSDRYRSLTPGSLVRALRSRGLMFDPEERTGATLHLLGALEQYGKLGTVCIGRTMPEAEALYENLVLELDRLAS